MQDSNKKEILDENSTTPNLPPKDSVKKSKLDIPLIFNISLFSAMAGLLMMVNNYHPKSDYDYTLLYLIVIVPVLIIYLLIIFVISLKAKKIEDKKKQKERYVFLFLISIVPVSMFLLNILLGG